MLSATRQCIKQVIPGDTGDASHSQAESLYRNQIIPARCSLYEAAAGLQASLGRPAVHQADHDLVSEEAGKGLGPLHHPHPAAQGCNNVLSS